MREIFLIHKTSNGSIRMAELGENFQIQAHFMNRDESVSDVQFCSSTVQLAFLSIFLFLELFMNNIVDGISSMTVYQISHQFY